MSSASKAASGPEYELQAVIRRLRTLLTSRDYASAASLLTQGKAHLLRLNALLPSSNTPRAHLILAREVLEAGALTSLHLRDMDAFVRYVQQLQGFYVLPESVLPRQGDNASKITGLYMLLLLSRGDYAAFHTVLETLEVGGDDRPGRVEDDKFIQYPVRLEQALMEGSYDRVWGETKGNRVPAEEFSIFSEVLVNTIRLEIASCSEQAYPSVPISNAKNLFFLESEGQVVEFAKERGWTVRDGRIYFPHQEQEGLASEKDILTTSKQVIENTLGYTRELETIV
ncbi:hypothetical protein EJ06DRAFT_552672 [Trichodelitschia bisporula]|uniref:PCI domain-containing protein n=1 Tax=Trichodelitschia bisporula TaxID=703511 RepID=A0A6G1IB94_9PEZI|nr:hypothetical protein EJ06DRAFT_552672 [Trichodelitschia bisporula]